MGVTEKMAHIRIYTQIQLEFYVDRDYKVLKFLEHWMEFISGGSGVQENTDGYYYRMSYPEDYSVMKLKLLNLKEIMIRQKN